MPQSVFTNQGLNDWVETDNPHIELFQDGAVVRNLQYSVIFNPNLASQGAVDISLPSGERLTGQIMGLAFTEGDRSVLIAQTRDCAGEVSGRAVPATGVPGGNAGGPTGGVPTGASRPSGPPSIVAHAAGARCGRPHRSLCSWAAGRARPWASGSPATPSSPSAR